MGSRRSRFQISVDVLTAVASGEQKTTRIMYACNLSWNSIKDTLDLLASKGYVDEIKKKNRKRYFITSKGREVLRYYSGLQDLVQVSVD